MSTSESLKRQDDNPATAQDVAQNNPINPQAVVREKIARALSIADEYPAEEPVYGAFDDGLSVYVDGHDEDGNPFYFSWRDYLEFADAAISATLQALIELELPESVTDEMITADYHGSTAAQGEFRAALRALLPLLTGGKE